MGSISTSPNATTKLLLRLIDSRSGSSSAFSLHTYKEASSFEMATEGAVHENYAYFVELLSEVDLGSISLLVSVNGDEPERCAAPRSLSTMTWGGRSYWYYRCDLGESGWKLFESSYGFAAVEVGVVFSDGRPTWTLYTKDIPCICPYQDQEQAVSEMIDALSSTKNELASKWMFSGISPDAPSSALVEGGMVADSSQTLSGYLEFVDRVVNSYEENLPYFRVRAHSRTLKKDEIVNPVYARKLGRRELTWMARNAESMYRVDRATGLRVNGEYYMATEVQTERSVKSFDNDENRAVLSFIKEISSSLRSVSDRVEAEVGRLRAMESRLSGINSGGGTLLSRVIIEACIKREAPLAVKAEMLRRRCQGLMIAYERALPGVLAVRYRKPRRSKVFQEVRPYADIFSLMCIWPEFEGFDLVRDGLLLHTFKIDKLYEYFALLSILEWLAEAGFVEDERHAKPIVSFRYTHRGRRFSNETQVANLYRLTRGGLSVALYYQPVIYGDNCEENGITLHRVSTTAPFSRDGRDSVWTPDFLVVLEGERFGARKHIVLDAKFRPVYHLTTNTRGEKGEYAACSFKYKISTASSGQDRVDALWLLCGKAAEPESYLFQESSWANNGGVAMRDGIAALSPAASALDDMFAEMGIEKTPLTSANAYSAEHLPEKQAADEAKVEVPNRTSPALSETSENHDSLSVASNGTEEASAPDDRQGGLEQIAATSDGGTPQNDSSKAEEADPAESGKKLEAGGGLLAKQKGKGSANSLAPDILDLILRICDLTFDKKALFHAGSAQQNFGCQHPLLMKAMPSEKDAKLYTRERIEVAGEPCYVFSAWKPLNIQKLKNAVRQAEKALEKTNRESEESGQPEAESRDQQANLEVVKNSSIAVETEATASAERKATAAEVAESASPSEESPLPGIPIASSSKAGSDAAPVSASRLHSAAPPSRSKNIGSGLDDETFKLIDRVVTLTFDKKSLYGSGSSQKAFGFQHPLLRMTAPSGKAARLYTRDPIDVGGERCYVYATWKPMNVQKLKNTLRLLEKVSTEDLSGTESCSDRADEAVSPPEASKEADGARPEDLKREAARKRTQLPDDSPFKEEISLSYRRVSGEWLPEKNKGISFAEYASGKDATKAPAWWQGECGHKWRARLSERLVDPLCPACLAVLKAQDERAAKLFHRTKNGNGLLSSVAAGAEGKSCWWRCSKNHDWQESLESLRDREYACPECSGKIGFVQND